MLGLTTYQEALRALGRVADGAAELRITEYPDQGSLELATPEGTRRVGAAELEDIVLMSLAKRGEHRPAGDVSDVLRSVGLALDELRALDVKLALASDRLEVEFDDAQGRAHTVSYVGEELEALRRSAAARRNGQPLRRILVLQAAPESAASLSELLLAEFAVQSLPKPYARAIAATAEPPDLVLAQVCSGTADAVRTLRTGKHTRRVPIVALSSPERAGDEGDLFAAGADDLLHEPIQPAQLRARIRTWLLRGRATEAQ